MTAADQGRPIPAADAIVLTAAEADPLPPRRPLASCWDFAVRAWRPVLSWVCVLVLFVNGVVLPLAQIWGVTFTPLSWSDLSVFVLPLIANGVSRTVEKIQGVTS